MGIVPVIIVGCLVYNWGRLMGWGAGVRRVNVIDME